jgi:putative flippase GtrA
VRSTPRASPLALGAGTLVGLVVKYVLDKRWIFFDETRGARAQGGNSSSIR